MSLAKKVPRCLRAALAYAERGWRVLPLRPHRKEPVGRLVRHGLSDATTDGDMILRWWSEEPEAGVAIATGEESGIWVLDIDGPIGALILWDKEAKNGPIHTLAQRTGRENGGRQLFFSWPSGMQVKCQAEIVPGIDVRGRGGYVIAPPSVHPSGRRYTWEGKVALADAPKWMLKFVGAKKATRSHDKYESRNTPYGQKAADGLEEDLAMCGQGGRDKLAIRTAIRLFELEKKGEIIPREAEIVLRRALTSNGYMHDRRRERGEAGLQRILASARKRTE